MIHYAVDTPLPLASSGENSAERIRDCFSEDPRLNASMRATLSAAASARASTLRAVAEVQDSLGSRAPVAGCGDSDPTVSEEDSADMLSTWDSELICTALLEIARAESEQAAERAACRVRLVLGGQARCFDGLIDALVRRVAQHECLRERLERGVEAGPVSIPPVSIPPVSIPPVSIPPVSLQSLRPDRCSTLPGLGGASDGRPMTRLASIPPVPSKRAVGACGGVQLQGGLRAGRELWCDRSRPLRRRSRPNVW